MDKNLGGTESSVLEACFEAYCITKFKNKWNATFLPGAGADGKRPGDATLHALFSMPFLPFPWSARGNTCISYHYNCSETFSSLVNSYITTTTTTTATL